MGVQMFCAQADTLSFLGAYKSSNTILGVFFFPDYYISASKFEMIRFMVMKGATQTGTISMGAITLPRSGSYLNSNIYQPMIYNEPTLEFEVIV